MEIVKYTEKIVDQLSFWKRSPNVMIVTSYDCKFEDGVDTTSNTVYFEPSIKLDSPDYEIGLVNLETYYSFPNIDSKNNKLRYFSKKLVNLKYFWYWSLWYKRNKNYFKSSVGNKRRYLFDKTKRNIKY